MKLLSESKSESQAINLSHLMLRLIFANSHWKKSIRATIHKLFYEKLKNNDNGTEWFENRNNWDKSAGSFCRQKAAWISVMFCNSYIVKNHKIANNSKIAEAREKRHRFGILRILTGMSYNLKTFKFYFIKLAKYF